MYSRISALNKEVFGTEKRRRLCAMCKIRQQCTELLMQRAGYGIEVIRKIDIRVIIYHEIDYHLHVEKLH